MRNDRNMISWHFVTDYNTGEVTGLRGWDSRLEDRYEMSQTDDPLIWRCSVINSNSSGDWWSSQIHEGGVLSCMVAAEDVADARYAKQQESEEHHEL